MKILDLPLPGYPMVTRVISNRLFPPEATASSPAPPKEEPITWIVNERHPLIGEMTVVRMFVTDRGVEVYSRSDDGQAGMRNLVPMDGVRLVEEVMPPDVFIEELSLAEAGEDPNGDDGDEDDDEGLPHEIQSHPISNGQPTP